MSGARKRNIALGHPAGSSVSEPLSRLRQWVYDRLGALIVVGLFSTIFLVYAVTLGFLMNVGDATVGQDDEDCEDDGGPHDETERDRNGCVQHCEVHPVWWGWGRDRDCYWDDDAQAVGGGA